MLEKGDRKLLNSDDETVLKIVNKTREIAFKRIQELNLSEAKTKQKQGNVNKFFEIREKHIEARNTRRIFSTSQACLVQENVFKIPHKNGDLSKIQSQEYLDVAQVWFRRVNPFNKVILGVIHLDETEDTTKKIDEFAGLKTDKLRCRSGDNFHFFVDGKNSKTGEYDLRKTQIDFARKEQHKLNEIYGINFGLEEERGYRLTDKEMTLIGQIMQMSFYTEMQEQLFNKHDLALKFLNSTEKKSFDYLQACLEEQMPLNMRQNSRFAMKKSLTEKADIKLKQMNVQVNKKITRKNELSSEILKMLGDKNQISTEIKNLENMVLEQAITKVNKWMSNINKDDGQNGLTALTASAAVKAIDKLSKTQPKIAEQIIKTVTTFEIKQEKTIQENLKISDKVKSKIKYNKNDLHEIEKNMNLCIHNNESEKCKTCSSINGSTSKFKI